MKKKNMSEEKAESGKRKKEKNKEVFRLRPESKNFEKSVKVKKNKISRAKPVEKMEAEKVKIKIKKNKREKTKKTGGAGTLRKKELYLSVIIPAYNEAERLPITLLDMDKKLLNMDLPSYEILVVDDGSSDATMEVMEKFTTFVKNLKLISNKENHGKGFVVRQGMLAARGEIRLFMDADNSTTIDQFMKMKTLFDEGAQVVIGSRAIEGAELHPAQPFYKQILGKAGNLFIQALVAPGIWDTQCGFKAFRRTAAEDIFGRAKVDRWAFDVEVIALAKKLGYEIKEIPVFWVNDTGSHVKLSSYLQVLIETVKIAYRVKRGEGSQVKDGSSGEVDEK